MAAGVATNRLGSTDAGAQLRAAKVSEQRNRNRYRGSNLPGLKQARTAMLGASMLNASPSINPSSDVDGAANTQTIEAGEKYQRDFRQRQLARQIGESAGADLQRQYSYNPEPSELDLIEQNYAQQEIDLMVANQQGADQRSSAAKRGAQAALREAGFEEGLQHLQKEFQKEASAFAVSFGAGAGEVIDSAFEDFGVTEYVTFAQNQIQAARTILSPAPPPAEEAGNIHSLVDTVKQQATEAFMDTLFPRFNLHTLSGLTSLGKALLQWFVIALIVVIISLFVFIQFGVWYTVYSFVDSPLTTIMSFVRYQIGF